MTVLDIFTEKNFSVEVSPSGSNYLYLPEISMPIGIPLLNFYKDLDTDHYCKKSLWRKLKCSSRNGRNTDRISDSMYSFCNHHIRPRQMVFKNRKYAFAYGSVFQLNGPAVNMANINSVTPMIVTVVRKSDVNYVKTVSASEYKVDPKSIIVYVDKSVDVPWRRSNNPGLSYIWRKHIKKMFAQENIKIVDMEKRVQRPELPSISSEKEYVELIDNFTEQAIKFM